MESFKLHVTDQLSSEGYGLLSLNKIGEEGNSLVYQHKTVDHKLAHLNSTHVDFLELKHSNRLIGLAAFIHRSIGKKHLKATYIRYLTIAEKFRRKRGSNVKNNRIKRSKIRTALNNYLEHNSSDVHYAYVDLNNNRSKELCFSFGFKKYATFTSLVFSRYQPKNYKQVEEIELSSVITHIKQFYCDYQFFTFDNLHYKRAKCYIIKENNIVVAGFVCFKEFWKLIDMPGVSGKLIMSGKVPVINRLFRKEFRFLAIEGLFYNAEHKDKISPLIEGALNKNGLNTAMLWADVKSGVYKDLKEHVNFGLLNKLKKNHLAHVIVTGEIDEKLPCYISAFDLT